MTVADRVAELTPEDRADMRAHYGLDEVTLAEAICVHSYLDEDCIECWKREYKRAWTFFAAVVKQVGPVRIFPCTLNEGATKLHRYDDPATTEVVFSAE